MASRFFNRSASSSIKSYGYATRAHTPCFSFGFKRSLCVVGTTGRQIEYKTSNGNEGVVENGTKMVIKPIQSTGSVFTELKKNLFAYLDNKRHGPRPRFLDQSSNEIRFEIPACGLAATNIKMSVDGDNRFILTAQNNEQHLKQHIDLPSNANFEKAVFKAKLHKGMVHVTVTNFSKEDVVVRFDPDES